MSIYHNEDLRHQLNLAGEKLDTALLAVVDLLRQAYPPEDFSTMNFIVRVSGVVDKELSLVYGFSKNPYQYSPDVTGSHVVVALVEFLRRHGYEQKFAARSVPMLIESIKDNAELDQII